MSLAPSVSGQEAATVPGNPVQFHLFVLAGQSNMAGRGKVAAEDKQIDPRVWMLDESLQWVPAVDPLHFDKPSVAGVGMGKTFAIDYANAHPGIQVGLIPCAVGGSAITNWQPGGFHDQTKTHPWDDCVARVNEAMRSGVLKGFLWHQGESDSQEFEAAKYEERLTELIERFRDTFSAPNIPFLIGQLGRFDGRPWNEYREQVDAAQQEVARTLPHCAFVSSEGLDHRGDHLHFNAESAREFGHRYYSVYAKMTDDRQQMLDKLGISKMRPGRHPKATAEDGANYDEARANPFPDWPEPLTLDNGRSVTSPELWTQQRRAQIVESFEREVYGRVPKDVPAVTWASEQAQDVEIAGVPVTQQQLTGTADNSGFPAIDVKIAVTLLIPKPSDAPVSVLVMIDPTDRSGANDDSRFDERIEELVAAGWAVAVMNPWSVQADNGAGLTSGIIGLANHGQPRQPDQWGVLRAWAWGASRVLDFLTTDARINSQRICVEGVSRYGKAALLAMAMDERFAAVLVGSSGAGGAAPHRRDFGESVENLTAPNLYHWMAGNFLKYGAEASSFGAKNANDIPVDSHQLIALCAPRLTFISYGIPERGDTLWLDQRGSWMATVAASPVFELLGVKGLDLKGLGVTDDYRHAEMPPVNHGLLDGHLAWRQHDAGHTDAPNISSFIKWADAHFVRSFEVVDPNPTLSPFTGMAREHWIACGRFMLEGAFAHVKSIDDPMLFPKVPGKSYPRKGYEKCSPKELSAAIFEGVARTFNVAAPLIADDPDLTIGGIRLADYYKYQILQLTDPESPYFIGDGATNDGPAQQTCELGNLALWMLLLPDVLWEKCSQAEQDQIAKAMHGWAHGWTKTHNWRWFNVMMLTFLKQNGYEIDESLMLSHLDHLLMLESGEGWFRDQSHDYYSVHVFQLYGSVWNRVYGRQHEPARAEHIDEQFDRFMENYPAIFSRDGKVNMWGRSIIYRMGGSAGLPAAFLGHPDPRIDPGFARRLASGALLQFVTHPDFFENGVPSLGFYGHFEPAVQPYSCAASPYWMFMNFTGLTLPKDHPFWTSRENEGFWPTIKQQPRTTYLSGAGLLMVNDATTGTSELINGKIHNDDPSYCRLTYNTDFPWEANADSGPTAAEIMLQPFENDRSPEFPEVVNLAGFEKGVLYRQAIFQKDTRGGTPCFVDMADIVIPGGRICVHRWRKVSPANLYMSHFGLPHLGGNIEQSDQLSDGKQTMIVKTTGDQGETRQLAVTNYQGWDAVQAIEHKGLHPEAEDSTLVYVRRTDKSRYGEPEILVSILLQKTDGESWDANELQPIESLEPITAGLPESLSRLKLVLKSGESYTIDFTGIDGSSSH